MKDEQTTQVEFTSAFDHEGFLGLEATRLRVFPDSASRPSKRAWSDWKSRIFFMKTGGRIFCDPNVVRAELTERFTVPAATK